MARVRPVRALTQRKGAGPAAAILTVVTCRHSCNP